MAITKVSKNAPSNAPSDGKPSVVGGFMAKKLAALQAELGVDPLDGVQEEASIPWVEEDVGPEQEPGVVVGYDFSPTKDTTSTTPYTIGEALKKGENLKKTAAGHATTTLQHTVASTAAEDPEEVFEEQVPAPHLMTAASLAKVDIELGRTINTGNYSSARFSVRLTMPCDPEHLDSTYQFVEAWVSDRVIALAAQVSAPANQDTGSAKSPVSYSAKSPFSYSGEEDL